VREDCILTLSYGGLIYTPGSAGTMQEIFQEAVQNHYLSFGFASPMIFLGKSYWTDEMPVYPLLNQLMATGKYKNLLLTLTDDIDEVVDVLVHFSQSEKPRR
jgi:predicted Rossmann-fold nucleotide-binding protein